MSAVALGDGADGEDLFGFVVVALVAGELAQLLVEGLARHVAKPQMAFALEGGSAV